jgi:thymidylate synthase
MRSYLNLLDTVLELGQNRHSRVGDTISVFGQSITIDSLKHGYFPLVTTRKLSPRGVLGELAAFLWGAQSLKAFKTFGCNYWDHNAKQWEMNEGLPVDNMSVGRIYGVQWRDWNGKHDQLAALVDGICNDPTGRRHILTTWNPSELDQMCLPPCHLLAQFYVTSDGYLDCIVYMRSVDICLGLPSDISLYAALLVLVAHETNLKPGKLTFFLGDAHVYAEHLKGAAEQLNRTPLPLPRYTLHKGSSLFNFHPDDLQIIDYAHHEAIKYVLL